MLKANLLAVITGSMVLFWPALSAADNTVTHLTAAHPVLIAQQVAAQQVEITGKLRAAPDGSGWEIVTNDDKVYHIQNPGLWTGEDWFDSGSTVQITGNLRLDTVKATVVASQITHVKVSEVRTTRDKIQDEIQKQIEKQTSGNKLQNLLKKIPFLGKLFDRIGQ
jgi:hypothetical protein